MERRIYLFFRILIYSVLCFLEFIIVIGAPSVHRTQLVNLEIRKLRQGEAEQVAQSHTELVLEPGFKPRHLGSRVFTFTTVLGSLPDMPAVCVCVCVCNAQKYIHIPSPRWTGRAGRGSPDPLCWETGSELPAQGKMATPQSVQLRED